ncbi:MAG: hypothetical protein V3R99_11470, partial [Thermoguttaceae bacterium]
GGSECLDDNANATGADNDQEQITPKYPHSDVPRSLVVSLSTQLRKEPSHAIPQPKVREDIRHFDNPNEVGNSPNTFSAETARDDDTRHQTPSQAHEAGNRAPSRLPDKRRIPRWQNTWNSALCLSCIRQRSHPNWCLLLPEVNANRSAQDREHQPSSESAAIVQRAGRSGHATPREPATVAFIGGQPPAPRSRAALSLQTRNQSMSDSRAL